MFIKVHPLKVMRRRKNSRKNLNYYLGQPVDVPEHGEGEGEEEGGQEDEEGPAGEAGGQQLRVRPGHRQHQLGESVARDDIVADHGDEGVDELEGGDEDVTGAAKGGLHDSLEDTQFRSMKYFDCEQV